MSNGPELSRRTFLQGLLAVPVGVAAEAAYYPIGSATDQVVEDRTGHPAGNPFDKQLTANCAAAPDQSQCINAELAENNLGLKIRVVGPVVEEFAFRGVPSAVMDAVTDKELTGGLLSRMTSDRVVSKFLVGQQKWLLNRREIVAGLIGATTFGLTHSLTPAGVDANTIPASQFEFGLMTWYLQRTRGIFANITAHIMNNTIATNALARPGNHHPPRTGRSLAPASRR